MAKCEKREIPQPPVEYVLTLSGREMRIVLCAMGMTDDKSSLEEVRRLYTEIRDIAINCPVTHRWDSDARLVRS